MPVPCPAMTPLSRRKIIQLGAAASAAPLFSVRAQEPGSKPLGIALLGLGKYATEQLAPAIEAASNARLAGIVTGSPDKIPTWQKKHGIPEGNIYNYDNFDSIADNPDIDVVYVVTPTGLHADFSVRAAEAGKHVISEKPMAGTVEECTRMIEAANRNDRLLQIGYRLHWEPHHLRLMEAMRVKEFGPWKSIDTGDASRMTNFTDHNAWRVDRELGIAGALYDLGVYAVQAAMYSAQEHPISVTARSWTEREEPFSEVPEHWEWELTYPGGRTAKGMASYGKNANFVRVETEEGPIEIQPAYGYSGQEGSTPEGPMRFDRVHQQKLQIEGQVDAILRKERNRVPGEMGRRDIRILQGIMEAARTGKPHEFGEWVF